MLSPVVSSSGAATIPGPKKAGGTVTRPCEDEVMREGALMEAMTSG